MKRNMDLVRELLLKVEDLKLPRGSTVYLPPEHEALQVEGFDPDEIAYHLDLLFDAGFVSGNRTAMDFGISGLSWSGHDFVASVRDPKIWRETKEGASKAGGFTLDLLSALAKGLIKKKIEEHTGVKLDL